MYEEKYTRIIHLVHNCDCTFTVAYASAALKLTRGTRNAIWRISPPTPSGSQTTSAPERRHRTRLASSASRTHRRTSRSTFASASRRTALRSRSVWCCSNCKRYCSTCGSCRTHISSLAWRAASSSSRCPTRNRSSLRETSCARPIRWVYDVNSLHCLHLNRLLLRSIKAHTNVFVLLVSWIACWIAFCKQSLSTVRVIAYLKAI